MSKDDILLILALLMVSVVILSAVNLAAAQDNEDPEPEDPEVMNKYEKGHTGLHGKTWQADSNFVFELSGPYWYKNLDLYLETWKNSSDYRVVINNEQVESGTIYEGKTHMNYTLPTDQPCNLKVEIDNYTYSFRNKLITERSSENWKQPDKDKDGTFYSEGALLKLKIFTWLQALLGIAIATPIAYYTAKIKKEGEITEVID